jgi:iron(III) transport system ATP-binding protein
MLTVEHLSKIYANTGDGPSGGVRDAGFVLEAGAFFTLLGPSGCGKTTTLRCVAGLEEPDSGVIKVGDEVFCDTARGMFVSLNRRRIGMVFQSYAIWPHMTVFENVAFPLRVAKDRRYDRAEIARMVDEALETVSLSGFGGRASTRLSGGQQQRVALARAIVAKPKLLLLDEPLSNLDAALREDMRNELRSLQKQIGVTTVYVTHDQTEALEMSDLIAVMQQGVIVQLAPPREIYFQPRNAFVARFVGTTNWLEGTMVEHLAGGHALIKLHDDTLIQCRVAPDERKLPRPALISVRPESIVLRPIASDRAEGCNRLTGHVLLTGFLGSMNRYQVDVGGRVIQAYGTSEDSYQTGDTVAVEFSHVSAMALDE